MEIVGGLKVENELFDGFIKSEDPTRNDEDVVEIKAEDIEGEIKQDPEENRELVRSEGTGNIRLDICNEEITNNQNCNEASLDEEEDLNETVSSTDVQEKLILNYKDVNLHDLKKPPEKESIVYNDEDNNKSKKVPVKQRSKRNRSKDAQDYTMRVYKSDYTLKKDLRNVINYHCNACRAVDTSKKNIIQHIKQVHRYRDMEDIEEKLKKASSNTKSRDLAWYEYSVEGRKYRCSHCQDLLDSRMELQRHIVENHRKADVWKQCPHCPFKTLFELRSHNLYVHTDHKDIEYFSCDKCEFKAKVKSHLRRHILAVHRDPNEILDQMYQCKQCSKFFKRNDVLQNHIRVVHNASTVEKIKCYHCSFECKSRDSMKHHIQSRHTRIEDLETLKCSQCEYQTKFKLRLSAHRNITHRAVLQCHICSYQCKIKSTMDLHLIGHKKEKTEKDLKFQCDVCPYKTYRTYNLLIHKLNHVKPEDVQYFYCYHCKFKAKRKDNLKSHIFRHFKQNEVTFACYICEFTTQKHHILVKHMHGHSKEAAESKKESKTGVILKTIVSGY